MIERQVAHLVRLVDELLDMARIGRGRITLKRERLELERVISHGLEPVRPVIESRRQTLTVSLPTAPVWISGDFVRLGQIVTNLVNNAAKFTPEGGHIQIDATANQGQAVIVVRDTGVGIEAQLLPRIFDMFVQGERSLDRSEGGMGIGLTLARQLTELHQGRIEAHSEGPGKGTVFTVSLPCISEVASAASAPTVSKAAPIRACRVLVVDDNADAAESLAMLLQISGHETRVVTEAAQVVSASAEFMPQVAVLDIGLPGINGYELARQLRQQPGHAEVVLIALTGYGQSQDRKRAAEAGFDYHFVKPVDPGELEAAIGTGLKESGEMPANGNRASS
jgi:CheY-like chemotaxis protein